MSGNPRSLRLGWKDPVLVPAGARESAFLRSVLARYRNATAQVTPGLDYSVEFGFQFLSVDGSVDDVKNRFSDVLIDRRSDVELPVIRCRVKLKSTAHT